VNFFNRINLIDIAVFTFFSSFYTQLSVKFATVNVKVYILSFFLNFHSTYTFSSLQILIFTLKYTPAHITDLSYNIITIYIIMLHRYNTYIIDKGVMQSVAVAQPGG